ncbi:MAG: nucleotide exchange factor GrpE, partial [Candidatus Diapherotrites archaeon]|nr:nucleotide exchange factor GrpE [Candidatus Diapherotrites archaeon]
LGLLDSMDAAVEQLKGRREVKKEDALNGMVLLRKQLYGLLQSHGIKEIPAIGRQFDPMLHEALMQGKDPAKQDCAVLGELQKGYLLNGKVLRHAKVKVNKANGKKE